MGADYEGQERAIEELKNLSSEAKQYLSHHIRNGLNIVINGIQTKHFNLATYAARHIVADIERIGC
jgi:hypothetical protein